MPTDTILSPTSPAQERLPEIIRLLRKTHPDAKCALDFTSPLQLLVATILSAQCTDERVNKVTPALFARYPSAQAFAEADRDELEQMVHSTGFYRNKAKNVQEACRRIVIEYGGDVPADMTQLLTLAGVARKTANVVLGNCYAIADGVVVDTHVKRLSERLGLSTQTDPEKIERDLMQLAPKADWIDLSHLLIFHGRRVCDARKPRCAECTIRHLCPSAPVLD
jgi:endonuclease-3